MPNLKTSFFILSTAVIFLSYNPWPAVFAETLKSAVNQNATPVIHLTARQLERLRTARNIMHETLRGDFDKFAYEKMGFSDLAEAEAAVTGMESIAATYSGFISKRQLSFE